MSSKLFQLQTEFARLIPSLLNKAWELGYEVTLGDAYRDPRAFGDMGCKIGYGAANSMHKRKLAIDLNLFKNDLFQQTTEAHQELGEWWEQQHPMARWGGRFQDGNHYSFEYEGYK
jgi:hypothetical protein